MSGGFTHFDENGQAIMVDVGAKMDTRRIAIATGRISMQAETLSMITEGSAKKGDVLGVARVAAIMAAKKTSDLIPLCHPLALTKVSIEFTLAQGTGSSDTGSVSCTATAETTSKTGVEMEALTAVSVGLLTIYDMCKAVDRGMMIEGLRLLKKEGGKSGTWIAG